MSHPQSLGDSPLVTIKEKDVRYHVERDRDLKICLSIDFSGIIDEIKCKLFPIIAGEKINKRIANDIVDLAKNLKILIVHTVGVHRRRQNLDGLELTSDDMLNFQLYCLLMAAAGRQRVNLQLFSYKIHADKMTELGIELTPEESTRFDQLQFISKIAQEWLVAKRIITDIIPWDKSNFRVKVLVLGPAGVGKTSLLLRLQNGEYLHNPQVTSGLDYVTRSFELPNKCKVDVDLWDTAGSERFDALTRMVTRAVDGVLLVYDASDPTMTVDKVMSGSEDSVLFMHYLKIKSPDEFAPVVYFGNKADIEATHPRIQVDSNAATHYVGSAKTGANVEEAFAELFRIAAMFKYNRRKMPGGSDYNSIRSPGSAGSPKSNCC